MFKFAGRCAEEGSGYSKSKGTGCVRTERLPAAFGLSLPILDDDVPRMLCSNLDVGDTQYEEMLNSIGRLPNCSPEKYLSSDMICKAIEKQFGDDMSKRNWVVDVSRHDLTDFEFENCDLFATEGFAETGSAILVTTAAQDVSWLQWSSRFFDLEEKYPGLGQYLTHLIDGSPVSVLTPDSGMRLAFQNSVGMGIDDYVNSADALRKVCYNKELYEILEPDEIVSFREQVDEVLENPEWIFWPDKKYESYDLRQAPSDIQDAVALYRKAKAKVACKSFGWWLPSIVIYPQNFGFIADGLDGHYRQGAENGFSSNLGCNYLGKSNEVVESVEKAQALYAADGALLDLLSLITVDL